jgi:hypothetical protein
MWVGALYNVKRYFSPARSISSGDEDSLLNIKISFLPFLNLPPSSPDCIHSVLIITAQECKKLNQRIITPPFEEGWRATNKV